MRVSRDIKFLDTGHVTCRVYDRNFYGEGVVDRWGEDEVKDDDAVKDA